MKLNLLLITALILSSLQLHAERLYYTPLEKKVYDDQAKAIKAQQAKEEEFKREFRKNKRSELKQYQAAAREVLENLKKTPIHGIEILIAGSDATQAASVFGHSSLRLIMSEDPLDDIVIGPEAFVDDPELDMGKGISGGYTVIPKLMNFMDFLIQYHRGESRSVTRTILPTTPEMRLKLIDAFIKLNNNPETFGEDGYKFMTNNCASILMKAFAEAGIIPVQSIDSEDLQKVSWLSWIPVLAPYTAPFALSSDMPKMIPGQLRGIFKVAAIPNAYIPAIDIFFDEMKSLGSYFLSKKSEKWSKKDFDNLSKLSTRALYMLYMGPIRLSENLNKYVVRLLQNREFELNDIYNMEAYPVSLYNICKDTQCAVNNFRIIQKKWTKQERFLTANDWGLAPYKRFDIKKYQTFKGDKTFTPVQEYNLFMQNLYEADYKNRI